MKLKYTISIEEIYFAIKNDTTIAYTEQSGMIGFADNMISMAGGFQANPTTPRFCWKRWKFWFGNYALIIEFDEFVQREINGTVIVKFVSANDLNDFVIVDLEKEFLLHQVFES